LTLQALNEGLRSGYSLGEGKRFFDFAFDSGLTGALVV
jgi:hypothetical protein